MRVLSTAVAAALLAVSTSAALAQAALPAGDAAAGNPFTARDIDPAQPFGSIDVALAGATAEAVQTFATTLTAEQKLELTNRCQVISANVATYPETAQTFCGMWATAMANDPGATPIPGLGGADAPAAPAR